MGTCRASWRVGFVRNVGQQRDHLQSSDTTCLDRLLYEEWIQIWSSCFPEEPGEYLLVLERESGDSLQVEWPYFNSISGKSSRQPDENTKLVHSGYWSAYQFAFSVAHVFVPLRSGSQLENYQKHWGQFPFEPLEQLLAGRWT